MRILLIEDHHDTATVFARLLTHRAHTVRTASTCAEAKLLCEEEHFDVLVCDIGLPDGNGIDLVRQLRQLPNCDSPAIAMAGDVEPGDEQIGLDAGFVEYLIKPVHLEKLEDAIRRAAGNRS
jgi:two-component system CheB/CheR fusion protein